MSHIFSENLRIFNLAGNKMRLLFMVVLSVVLLVLVAILVTKNKTGDNFQKLNDASRGFQLASTINSIPTVSHDPNSGATTIYYKYNGLGNADPAAGLRLLAHITNDYDSLFYNAIKNMLYMYIYINNYDYTRVIINDPHQFICFERSVGGFTCQNQDHITGTSQNQISCNGLGSPFFGDIDCFLPYNSGILCADVKVIAILFYDSIIPN